MPPAILFFRYNMHEGPDAVKDLVDFSLMTYDHSTHRGHYIVRRSETLRVSFISKEESGTLRRIVLEEDRERVQRYLAILDNRFPQGYLVVLSSFQDPDMHYPLTCREFLVSLGFAPQVLIDHEDVLYEK